MKNISTGASPNDVPVLQKIHSPELTGLWIFYIFPKLILRYYTSLITMRADP